MAKSLSVWMRKRETEEVVEVFAPETFTDENGERARMKVKRLSTAENNRIYERYHYDKIATDENGSPIIRNNHIVKDRVDDNDGNFDRIIVEALVEPNLKSEEMLEYYGCTNVMEMPKKVFPSAKEYNYVRDVCLDLAGTVSGEESEYIIEEAKN